MTIADTVEQAIFDIQGDFPDVDESTVFHDAAYNACWDRFHNGGVKGITEANEYWKSHYGETFAERLTRPL